MLVVFPHLPIELILRFYSKLNLGKLFQVFHDFLFNFDRYSASTVDVLEMMDDEKVDLNLIAALIRHIVLEEEVSFLFFGDIILIVLM